MTKKYYYTLDKNGKIEFVFSKPGPNTLETTKEIIQSFDGRFYFKNEEPQPNKEEFLKSAKKQKMTEINQIFSVVVSGLTEDTPSEERDTWTLQSDEATRWEKDNTTPTPFLDIIATARDVNRVELIQRCLYKARLYQSAVASFAGYRQKLEDMILKAEKIEDLELIRWELSL